MPTESLIFVGFELTDSLRAELATVPAKHRVYLEDSAFLEVVSIDNVPFIGKRTEASSPLDRLEDAARNVVSLLGRVAPTARLKPSDAAVWAVETQGASVAVTNDDDGEFNTSGFEYSDLID